MRVHETRREAARRRDRVCDHVVTICDETGLPVHVTKITAIITHEYGVSDVTAYRYVTQCIHRGSLTRTSTGYVWPRLCGPPPATPEPRRVAQYGHVFVLVPA